MNEREATDVMELIRLLKQHAEINMDPTLLMLVAKLELLVQQQEDDLVALEQKVVKLKKKLQKYTGEPPSSSRRRKKVPETSETVDCYVAPSYLSVQCRAATGQTPMAANAAAADLLSQKLCDLSVFDAPSKPLEFPSKECKEADEVSSTTHSITDSSASGTDDRATECKRSDSSAKSSPTKVLAW